MKKVSCTLILFFASMAMFTNQVDFRNPSQDSESSIYQVHVKVVLPNSETLTAVVAERGSLEITIGDEFYIFEPRIIDIERRDAAMEITYASPSVENLDNFRFEIIDIIRFPLDGMKQMADCDNGTCCVTCGTVTACACGVKMSCNSCCCTQSCCKPLY